MALEAVIGQRDRTGPPIESVFSVFELSFARFQALDGVVFELVLWLVIGIHRLPLNGKPTEANEPNEEIQKALFNFRVKEANRAK